MLYSQKNVINLLAYLFFYVLELSIKHSTAFRTFYESIKNISFANVCSTENPKIRFLEDF